VRDYTRLAKNSSRYYKMKMLKFNISRLRAYMLDEKESPLEESLAERSKDAASERCFALAVAASLTGERLASDAAARRGTQPRKLVCMRQFSGLYRVSS